MNITRYIKERIIEDYGSVRRLAKKIGVPTSTLNTALNKENGFNNMPVEKALKVCNALGLDAMSLYDMQLEPLTVSERKLVDVYKSLSQRGKDFLTDFGKNLYDYESKEMTTLIPIITAGHIPTTELDYYPQAAGMGGGQYVTDAFPEKINVPSFEVPPKADFIIQVVGDSMEPSFKTGDKLFIESTNVLNLGDIGVFNYLGEQLVKEFGKGELISHNKSYEPIRVNEKDLYIQGRVLGKV